MYLKKSNYIPTINNLKENKYQVSYIHPVTYQRKRKVFTSISHANSFKQRILYRYKLNDIGFFIDKDIKTLCTEHLVKFPESGLDKRKVGYKSFINTFGSFYIHELSTPTLSKWLNELKKEKNYSPRSIHHIKVSLNKLFSTLMNDRVINYNPLSRVKIDNRYSPKRSRVYFSEDELKQMLNLAKQWEKAGFDLNYFYSLFYTIASTGARRSEALNLKWQDISFPLRTITFRSTKTKDDRTITMSQNLLDHFQGLERKNDFVFTNRFGAQVYMNMAQRHLKLFIKENNLKTEWGYHALRHSFTYNYLKKSGQMYQLQAILGHHRITTTIDIRKNYSKRC